jgi:two-component system KDP operon response regulator KdpE
MVQTLERMRPRLALAGGIGAIVVIVTLADLIGDGVNRAIPALLLVVPVVFAAVVGGRVLGFIVAGLATVAFSLALPPVGSPRVRFGEDVVALVVFSVVAFVVSALVTTRVASLENLDEQRRALLRSVSHDLRTPLAAVRAVATDLRAGTEYDTETRNALLDVLIDETERLDRLVANLLSMSRIETGTLRPRVADVDLAALLAQSTHRLERMFRDWKLVVDVPEQLPLVRADPAQLEQVVNNLLDNVVQHTPAGTCVRVSARADDDTVELVVADNGPGLPAEIDASGLGLAICRGIVAAHGGSSTMTHREPASRSPSPEAAEVVVLVIDDEPAIGQVLDAALRVRGYRVRIATTGSVGLQLASAVEPDVVILDLGLPDLDGVDICRRLRRSTSIPVIVLTVDGAEDRKVEALDAGADDYVAKPFSMPELLARVRVAVRHRRMLGPVSDGDIVRAGPLRIDAGAYEAVLGDEPLQLTRKEFALLTMLARSPGRVILHRVLLAGVWGDEPTRVELLRTHVNQLRRKLGDEPGSPVHIVNEPGVGYRLTLEEDA